MKPAQNGSRVLLRPVRTAFGRAPFVLALFVACGTLPGCRGASGPQASASAAPVQLRIGVSQPSPQAPRSLANTIISDSLIGIGWNGRPVGRLVDEWGWTSDGLGLRLRLRPNLQFHDGTPIDVQFFSTTLERTLKAPPDTESMVSYQSVKSVEIDPENREWVIVKLTRPEAFLIADLGNIALRHPTNDQIGTGPYKLDTSGPTVRLTAFDQYYRGRPKIAAIEINNFREPRASWAALMRGEIDAVHEIAPNAVDFVDGQTVNTYAFVRPYYIQLLFNVRHPLLKKPAVRQALSYGVDRQQIVDLALNKQGTVAEGPIWPYHWAYSTAEKTYTHNSEVATLRLDSAGLKIKPSSEKGRMPSRLRIRCLTVANDDRYEKIALVLQKQLYEIGVDLEIETAPGNEVVKRLNSGDFDTVLIPRSSGRSLAWTYLTYHSAKNRAGYTAADAVLDTLRQTTEEALVRTYVSDLQQIFHDDPPAIFIAWPKVARGVSSRFVVPDDTDESNRRDDAGREVLSSLWQGRLGESPR